MMFKNPFPSLVTRTGLAIGHAGERVMTQAVGGLGGIRKRLQTNADGSTTMLHTQNGLARFSTSGRAAAANEFIVGPSDITVGEGWANHEIAAFNGSYGGSSFMVWIVPRVSGSFTVDSVDEYDFSLSGDTVTISPSYHQLWYPFNISVHYAGVAEADIGKVAYELHLGSSRANTHDFGVATVLWS